MTLDIAEFDSKWRETARVRHTLHDQFINPHDFAVTESSYVFFQTPMKFDMLPYLLGRSGPAECVNFQNGLMKIHVVPRNGGTAMVSLKGFGVGG